MAPPVEKGRRWLIAAHLYGALVAVVLGYFLFRIPIQLTDSLANLMVLDRPLPVLMRDAVQQGYFRPGLWAEFKAVYELSDGNYFLGFRLTHAVQAFLVIALFIQLLQPRRATAALLVPLALAALIGGHTFSGLMYEAYPVNAFVTIVICTLAAAVISFARYRWWNDVAIVVLFAGAVSAVESGVLVWVVAVAGYLIGLRGVSGRGVGALGALLAFYFVLRFAVFDVGVPALDQREAGFGFERYEVQELTAMFGGGAAGFYAYNVAVSVLGVLFAEPRNGVWALTRAVAAGQVEPALVVAVVSSALSTLLIGLYVWRRRAALRARSFDRGDRIVLLFLAVLAANAVVSYAYTKDMIVSPAGAFFAAALFVACVDLVDRYAEWRRPAAAASLVLLMVVSTSWAVRAVGLHARLNETSTRVREEWARADDFLRDWGYEGGLHAPEAALARELQADAIDRPAYPPLRESWTRLFELD